jgi:hypothetical protein
LFLTYIKKNKEGGNMKHLFKYLAIPISLLFFMTFTVSCDDKGKDQLLLLPAGGTNVIGVKLERSTNQVILATTDTAISFDTVVEDTDGFYNGSNPTRITIPAKGGGYYLIEGQLWYENNATNLRHSWILVNGVDFYALDRGLGMAAAQTGLSSIIVLKLSAGDYIELMTWQNSGGSLNVITLPDEGQPFFSAYRIGK